MAYKFALGFTHVQAREYFRERGGAIDARGLVDAEGNQVIVVGGDPYVMAGVEVAKNGGLVFGPNAIDGQVVEIALSRARL